MNRKFLTAVVIGIALASVGHYFIQDNPTQILDTPEPLHLKQDEVEIPTHESWLFVLDPPRYCLFPSGEPCIPISGEDNSTAPEEIDQPVVLSASSSGTASSEPLKTRPPFIPHHKVWKTSSSEQSAVSLSATSSALPSNKPLFCFLTGTGSRAEAKKNYCNSLK